MPRGRRERLTFYFRALSPGLSHPLLQCGCKLIPNVLPVGTVDQARSHIVDGIVDASCLCPPLKAHLLAR